MFKKKHDQDMTHLSETAPMMISGQSRITGDLMLSTDITIDGYVQGNVETVKTVIIGEKGYMEGTLKCQALQLWGHFHGGAEVSETACLFSTAVYTGRLNAPCISVSPGCRVDAVINPEGKENVSPCKADQTGKVVPVQRSGPENEGQQENVAKKNQKDVQDPPTATKSFLLNNLSKE